MNQNDREKDVVSTLDNIEKEIVGFKSTQIVGASSLVIYNNQTSNTWDVYNEFINSFSDQSQWIVTFTPTLPQSTYAELEIEWQFTMNPTQFDQVYYWDNAYIPGVAKSFVVWLQNNFNYDQRVNMKFGVRATSPGTITWQRVI